MRTCPLFFHFRNLTIRYRVDVWAAELETSTIQTHPVLLDGWAVVSQGNLGRG